MAEKSRFQRDPEAVEASRARARVEAEAAAHAGGKETFDLARLELLLGEDPGALTEHADSLRSKYYLLHKDVRTLAEYAKLNRELEIWR